MFLQGVLYQKGGRCIIWVKRVGYSIIEMFVCADIRGMVVTNYSSDIEITSAEHVYTVYYAILNDLMVNFR